MKNPDSRFWKFPVARRRSRRRTQQSLQLIKAHGFRVDLGALGELPSCETIHGFSVNPVGDYRVKGIRDSDRRCIRDAWRPLETANLTAGFVSDSLL